ncbi:MAG: glycosyltransferase family 2 protein [Rhodospirillales bacterium]
MSKSPYLSIVLPVYNEVGLLEDTLRDIQHQLAETGHSYEVVLVENGSTDGSVELCARLASVNNDVRVSNLSWPDYGLALKTGILLARGEYVVNFSADWWDIPFIDKAISLMNDVDYIIGSKSEDPSADTRSFIRKYGSAVFHHLERLFFPMPIGDTHGLKVIKSEIIQPVAGICHFGSEVFETELAARSLRAGVRIGEITIAIEEIRPGRINILKRGVRALWHLSGLRCMFWLEDLGIIKRPMSGARAGEQA